VAESRLLAKGKGRADDAPPTREDKGKGRAYDALPTREDKGKGRADDAPQPREEKGKGRAEEVEPRDDHNQPVSISETRPTRNILRLPRGVPVQGSQHQVPREDSVQESQHQAQRQDDDHRPVPILKKRARKDEMRLPEQVEQALGPSPGFSAEGSQPQARHITWELPPSPVPEEEPVLTSDEEQEPEEVLARPRLHSDRRQRTGNRLLQQRPLEPAPEEPVEEIPRPLPAHHCGTSKTRQVERVRETETLEDFPSGRSVRTSEVERDVRTMYAWPGGGRAFRPRGRAIIDEERLLTVDDEDRYFCRLM
jgi:hypothetical protein